MYKTHTETKNFSCFFHQKKINTNNNKKYHAFISRFQKNPTILIHKIWLEMNEHLTRENSLIRTEFRIFCNKYQQTWITCTYDIISIQGTITDIAIKIKWTFVFKITTEHYSVKRFSNIQRIKL